MAQQQKAGHAGTPIDAARIEAWIGAAQPGARIVYFHGVFAGLGDQQVNDTLMAEAERGMLYLVQDFRTRDERGHDYLAIRSSRSVGAGKMPERSRHRSMAEQARGEGERAFRSSGQ